MPQFKLEKYLGLPDNNGQVLVSTTSGVRSWVDPESPLTFTTPNLERVGDDVYFRNFSIFLGQTGRGTLTHDNAMNTADISYTFWATRPQGSSTFSTSKGSSSDSFYYNVLISTSGNVVANMKKNPQNIAATATGAITDDLPHKIRISYNDVTDRKIHLYVDDVLVASSTAFTGGVSGHSNTADFLWDMGQGVTYFTRPVLSSDPDYDPDYDVVTDANTIFYFPIRTANTNPVDTINGWTMTLNSAAKHWFGKELPLGLDAQLQATFDLVNKKIGEYFWWNKDSTGVALLTTTGIPITFLDWESSEWLQFYSEEDGTPQVTGDFNFQTRQNFFEGISIDEGTNKTMGVATLSGGTVTVNTNKATANARIFLTAQSNSGTEYGFVKVSARSAGNSFTITSYRGNNSTTVASGDTSTVAWWIVEPGY